VKRGSRRIARLPIAALAAIGVLALAGAAAPSRPADPVPQRHVVEIRGMAFHPEVLEVRRGDTVVWINRDIVPHTATATRKSGQKPAWNTGPLLQGQSGQYVASHRGEDSYLCQLHPVMLGKLIVR
jgi:plastocyanin